MKLKSILLLFLLGTILFPWATICFTHPLGHEHHQHKGASPCELHRKYAHAKGMHILPPMDCKHMSAITDDLQESQKKQIKAATQIPVFIAVVLEFIYLPYTEQPHIFPPGFNCRSATLISDKLLRGPPIV